MWAKIQATIKRWRERSNQCYLANDASRQFRATSKKMDSIQIRRLAVVRNSTFRTVPGLE
jgi:hypothetical protein